MNLYIGTLGVRCVTFGRVMERGRESGMPKMLACNILFDVHACVRASVRETMLLLVLNIDCLQTGN